MFMEDADLSGNLAPTRFQNSRKTQKISPEIWHLHDSRFQGKRRRFLRKFGTYTIPEFKENAEDFFGNLAPTRLLSLRKTQKISPEIWHLNDSYVEGTSRSFLRKAGTYTTPMLKELAEVFSGNLVPT